jgi:hypothetical protein
MNPEREVAKRPAQAISLRVMVKLFFADLLVVISNYQNVQSHKLLVNFLPPNITSKSPAGTRPTGLFVESVKHYLLPAALQIWT